MKENLAQWPLRWICLLLLPSARIGMRLPTTQVQIHITQYTPTPQILLSEMRREQLELVTCVPFLEDKPSRCSVP